MSHLDKNGTSLKVGDWVQYGLSRGQVLILENWKAIGFKPATDGVYVSQIGPMGDCRAVPADSVAKIETPWEMLTPTEQLENLRNRNASVARLNRKGN